MVSAQASMDAGPRSWVRFQLASHIRVAIQMAVAVTGAVVLGSVLSGHRFYWAVIAAFVTFMGANNAGEQVRKGIYRIAGTVVGVLIGAVLAHVVGQRTGPAIAVILVALFFGFYLMRISYAFFVVGITVTVSQLYVQLDEFSDSVLLLRLEETALGAAVAAVTVLCVLPLRGTQVAGLALRGYVQALSDLVQQGADRLLDPSSDPELRAAARRLDAAHQSLVTTVNSLGVPFFGPSNSRREQFLLSIAASRHYARNLLVDTAGCPGVASPAREELRQAAARLTMSLGEIEAALQHDAGSRTYVRAASLFDVVAMGLDDSDYTTPAQLALRDLQLIDGAMATLADSVGLSIDDLDTRSQQISGRVGRG